MTAPTNMPQPLPWVNQVQPYLPGETAVPGVAEVVKLSSNESLLGPSPAAVQAAQRVSDLGRCPDGREPPQPTCLLKKLLPALLPEYPGFQTKACWYDAPLALADFGLTLNKA